MAKILVLFAHPALEKSRINLELIKGLPAVDNVRFHDLYQLYPEFNIDVQREQMLLLQHDIIVFQHPFYWYSIPPLLKQWIDLTLEHNWAYGTYGNFLKGKRVIHVLTAGGQADAYQQDGLNRYTINEFLQPLEQTSRLCGMEFMPPFVVYGTHRLKTEEVSNYRQQYQAFLEAICQDDFDWEAYAKTDSANAYLETLQLNS